MKGPLVRCQARQMAVLNFFIVFLEKKKTLNVEGNGGLDQMSVIFHPVLEELERRKANL